MIALMGLAFGALAAFLVPELIGVLSPGTEDTFSEWVWDLPTWAVWVVSVLFVLAGVPLIWAAGHFLEGNSRRKPKWRRREGD